MNWFLYIFTLGTQKSNETILCRDLAALCKQPFYGGIRYGTNRSFHFD